MQLRQRPRRVGFTLIELMAVVSILGILTTLGIPQLRDAVDRAKEAKAIGDLRAIVASITMSDKLPTSLAQIGFGGRLDPWGNPYIYAVFPPAKGKAPPKGARKDRFLVPINSEYDLYSMGKDGATSAPLTAKSSRDDIIVGNDGGFIGLARNF